MLDRLLVSVDPPARRAIAPPLLRFGPGAIRVAADAGIRIIALARGQAYRDVSRALRRLGIDVDSWPAPPAGLFVIEERTVYLRSRSPMTVAHEFAHGLDCALGGGVYRSSIDPRIRSAFANATRFVTPYAASAIDEYFAECMRAYVGANDPASPWPRATRARLLACDPPMHAFIAALFASELAAGVPTSA